MYHKEYIQILKEELVPALGCTEPIAIAFATARARKLLGELPDKMTIYCSGNIIKNVKGVVVPNAGGLKGVDVAAILGVVGGDSDKGLETLSLITPEHTAKTKELLQDKSYCTVRLLTGVENLNILVEMTKGDKIVTVEILNEHTNIIKETQNGNVLFSRDMNDFETSKKTNRELLNLKSIYEFATTTNVDEAKAILDTQISYNTKIAEEGLQGNYGANIGKILMKTYGDDIKTRAKAKAAAGSDARMSGCVLPVVINSGSGNQGMTVSLPVIEYAKELNASQEELYRALIISNLVAIHQKSGLGRLSAYCGAVSAACGSGAAITYLSGGSFDDICNTITNTLANVSGIVCDGAKSSCAAKIASSVDAALMGHYMSMNQSTFQSGDGIVQDEIENTLKSVGRLGRDGMKQTDIEILNIMIGN